MTLFAISELDDAAETRKSEIYSDGHCGYASEYRRGVGGAARHEPLPSFEESQRSQISLSRIDRAELRKLSRRHLSTKYN